MQIRDRIQELRRVRASSLKPNPRNWRTHPERQRNALRGVLAEIGFADALLVRELPDGSLELVDGHLRAETTPDALVPVLILDLDETEACKHLATLDPLAALAETDQGKLADLLAEFETDNAALDEMLRDLSSPAGIKIDEQLAASLKSRDIPISYQVIVECKDEEEQREVYESLTGDGRRCKVLTL